MQVVLMLSVKFRKITIISRKLIFAFDPYRTPYLCQVDTFFAVGSPLGVFLALRNVRIGIGNSL